MARKGAFVLATAVNSKMRLATIIMLLITAIDAQADNAWQTHVEGSGTPFESRWANTDPLTDESSAGTMLGSAGINAQDGDLNLYVVHPFPVADALISALAGEDLDCKYDNWRLAVDQQEFTIAETSESTDNSATFLEPQDDKAFWDAFESGSLLAVQVERTCDGDLDVATMVYSLSGSRSAVNFVLNKAPAPARDINGEPGKPRSVDSAELAAYQSAIAQKIQRSWAMPASVDEDTECVVMVRQTRTGSVTSANIVRCNGDDALRRSVEAAVLRASPLPEPPNPDLFQAELRIILRPDLKETESGINAKEPDLSKLDSETRQSIETACVGDFTRGPAPYRKCVERQLQSIEGAGDAPDLSRLDSETRQSIETACVGDFTRGPAPYRKCVERQLRSIGVR